MAHKITEVLTVPLKKVQADPNQPRKQFDADKLRSLSDSIRKHGIKQPLSVTKLPDGNFMLLDGERRYRAAEILGLKEVPIIIEEPKTETERLLIQFNIQQMHEEWSPIEKAHALIELSKALGMSLSETCRSLNLAKSESDRYTAFASLADMDAYVRSELPLEYVGSIRMLRTAVKTIKEVELEQEFTNQDAKKLEHRIIHSIKSGSVTTKRDLIQLKDAFTKNPKTIEQYLKDTSLTPTGLYLKTGAQGAHALRNVVYNATYLINNGRKFLKLRDVKVSPQQLAVIKSAHALTKELIDLVD